MSTDPISIFVSHSYRDAEVAAALVRLISVSLRIPAHNIRCTSYGPSRLSAGADFETKLRYEILNSKAFLFIDTPDGIFSPYSLFESGARWGASLPIMALSIGGLAVTRSVSPLDRKNHLDLMKSDQIERLLNEVADAIGLAPLSGGNVDNELVKSLILTTAHRRSGFRHPSNFAIVGSYDGFLVFENGVIEHQQTGLYWRIGRDITYTWDDAHKWTNDNQSLYGLYWRMPSPEELLSLFDQKYSAGIGYYKDGKFFPAKIHPVFQAIGEGSWVWSCDENGDAATAVNFYMGERHVLPKNNRIYSVRVFSVSSGPATKGRSKKLW